MSLGGPESSLLEEQAFARAAENGILIFAASGNDGEMVVNYPAAYNGAIAVGAVDSSRRLAVFSTSGSFLKLAAPGVSVLSTVPVGSASLAMITGSGLPPIQGDLMEGSPHGELSGPYVYCGLGKPGDFPAAVNGRIALLKRGDLTFADKAKNAKAAGAAGVIVFNNVEGIFSGTLGDATFDWPVTLAVSMEDGETMKQAPASTTISVAYQDYGYNQGTSMACPHAAGVAALVWSIARGASAAQIQDALLTSAQDLGDPGFDPYFGYGLVDALAATKKLAPGLFQRMRPVRR